MPTVCLCPVGTCGQSAEPHVETLPYQKPDHSAFEGIEPRAGDTSCPCSCRVAPLAFLPIPAVGRA